MKTQTIQKILDKKLIGTNSEIHGECTINLFGGGTGRTNKTILLDKVIKHAGDVVFEGYTMNDGQHTHIKINDVDTLEGMDWHKFAQAYGLVKK